MVGKETRGFENGGSRPINSQGTMHDQVDPKRIGSSKMLASIPLYPCTFMNSMLFSNSKDILCLPSPPPSPPPPHPQRDATPRANTAAGYITAGYITDPDTHREQRGPLSDF